MNWSILFQFRFRNRNLDYISSGKNIEKDVRKKCTRFVTYQIRIMTIKSLLILLFHSLISFYLHLNILEIFISSAYIS